MTTPEGKLAYYAEWKDANVETRTTYFDEDKKQKQTEGDFVDDKQQGKVIRYYADGKIM